MLQECPDIGEVIEKFVMERYIGADAWCRTGVLTFDGNARVGKKVTFSRIKEHLENTYQRKFSYGTVIELFVSRNKRRRSAKRHHGIAQVTCRRARKGFELKYSPDSHWSAAFYRGLGKIQYEDGCNTVKLMLIETMHQAFALTQWQPINLIHKTPVVHQALTTHTDYVNHYLCTLQTSYNFA